jgi:hypothetical protein
MIKTVIAYALKVQRYFAFLALVGLAGDTVQRTTVSVT